MTTQQQREAFERCTAVPEDAAYNTTFDEYRYAEHFGITHPINELYESFCDGAQWQAAQQVHGEAEPVAYAEGLDGLPGCCATIYPEQDRYATTPVYTRPQPAQQVPGRDEIIQCLLATQNNSEGETADLILGLCYAAIKQESDVYREVPESASQQMPEGLERTLSNLAQGLDNLKSNASDSYDRAFITAMLKDVDALLTTQEASHE